MFLFVEFWGILIFDEGHNIERCCEDAASFELKTSDITHAISDLQTAFDSVSETMNDPDEAGEESTQVYMNQLQNMLNLKKSLELLQDKILTLHLAGNQKLERMEKLSPGEELFELFANAGLTQKDFTDRVQGTVRVAVDAIMTATVV